MFRFVMGCIFIILALIVYGVCRYLKRAQKARQAELRVLEESGTDIYERDKVNRDISEIQV